MSAPKVVLDPPATGWQQYLNQKMLICMMLGFSSGLPLYLLINLIAAWFSQQGLNVKTIGLFGLVGFPYIWKFLWSPFMDRFQMPFLGRRRGWMLVTQVILLVVICSFGFFSPQTELGSIILLAGVMAFVSASQDIVVDAYRREMLGEAMQAPGTAVYVNAYKLSQLVPASLALILSAYMDWNMVFFVVGLFMLPGIVTTCLIKEPDIYGAPPKNLQDAVVLPFKEFLSRKGVGQALLILGFIFLYKLGDSMATALSTPFYVSLGFELKQIGLIGKNASLWASLAGGVLGAVWMVHTGVNRGLWVFGALQAIAILGFALLAKVGLNVWMLGLVIGVEAFAVGLGTAAFTAYIANTTDPRYTATQFALFTSLAAVPRTLINASTGFIVAQVGWFYFFLICFALALPGMIMLQWIAPWHTQEVDHEK